MKPTIKNETGAVKVKPLRSIVKVLTWVLWKAVFGPQRPYVAFCKSGWDSHPNCKNKGLQGVLEAYFEGRGKKVRTLACIQTSVLRWSRWQDLNLRPFGPEIRTDVFLCHIMPAVVIRRKPSHMPWPDMIGNVLLQFRCNNCRNSPNFLARVRFALA